MKRTLLIAVLGVSLGAVAVVVAPMFMEQADARVSDSGAKAAAGTCPLNGAKATADTCPLGAAKAAECSKTAAEKAACDKSEAECAEKQATCAAKAASAGCCPSAQSGTAPADAPV